MVVDAVRLGIPHGPTSLRPTVTLQEQLELQVEHNLLRYNEEMSSLRSLLKIGLFLLVTFSAFAFYNHGLTTSFPIMKSFTPPGEYRDHISPHVASWKTWFHPLQFNTATGTRGAHKAWNLLQHLGGNGPWIEKIDEGEEMSSLAPPEGCSVDQVHLVGY